MKTKVKIYNQITKSWETVEGRILERFWKGHSFMLHRWLDDPRLWVVSETQTTAKITSGQRTQKLAKEQALKELSTRTEENLVVSRDRMIRATPELRITLKNRQNELCDNDRKQSTESITSDLVLDMAKIHTLTTGDFK